MWNCPAQSQGQGPAEPEARRRHPLGGASLPPSGNSSCDLENKRRGSAGLREAPGGLQGPLWPPGLRLATVLGMWPLGGAG